MIELGRIRLWLRAVFRPGAVEGELTDELRHHIELETEKNIRAGMNPVAARRKALIDFGGEERYTEQARATRPTRVLEDSLADLRAGGRRIRRHPRFALLVMLTMGLGVGATAAVFGVVEAVLLRPLPLEEPDRVVQIWDEARTEAPDLDPRLSIPSYRDYRSRNQVFQAMAAMGGGQFILEDAERIETLPALFVSPELLPILGVEPSLGRGFLSREEEPGSEPVAMVSHGLWQRRLGGDPEAVGRPLSLWGWGSRGLSSFTFTVVGVLPPDFELPPLRTREGIAPASEPEILVPMGFWSWARETRTERQWAVLARLAPGVSLDRARADMDGIAAGISATDAGAGGALRSVVTPLPRLLRRQLGPALLLLWAAAGMVLVISGANVAGLLLGHRINRDQEMAIRSSLGAGRVRLLRQQLAEVLILSLPASGMGLLLAGLGMRALSANLPSSLYRLGEASLNLRVGGFALAISLFTAAAAGLAPALRRSGGKRRPAATEGPSGRVGRGHRAFRGLVTAQVALTLVTLAGAGLMLRTFSNLVGESPGFERENLLAVQVRMAPYRFSSLKSRGERMPLLREVKERVARLPGVVSVAGTSDLPLSGHEWLWAFTPAGNPLPTSDGLYQADFREVSEGYFAAMGIPLLGGRPFTETDVSTVLAWWNVRDMPSGRSPEEVARQRQQMSLPVVVNETMAAQLWPGGDPLGKGLYWGTQNLERIADPQAWDPAYDEPALLTVVGVAGEVKTLGLDQGPRPQVYLPSTALGSLLIRTSQDPLRLSEAIRAEIDGVNPRELSVSSVTTVDELFREAVAEERGRMILLGLFAALALILSGVGLFGVLAYMVAQRIPEIGVRVALGASNRDIVGLVTSEGVRVAAVGGGVGLVGGLALTRFLGGFLYGVSPTDPRTFAGCVLVMGVVGVVACYLPTRRALRLDPNRALNRE